MPPSSSTSGSAGTDPVSLARVLGDCFACAALIVDRHQRIVACTPAAGALLRLKPGRSALPASLRKLVGQCFATGEPQPAQTIPSKKKPGATVALSAGVAPIRRGRATEALVVLHNLAPLQPLELNLRRLDRLASVGTLSASMAHEIKNALVAVKTFVDLLLEKGDDAELAQTVSREMRRIDTMVGQMLKFVGPARAVFVPVRVHDVLNHSLRMVQHQIDDKLISLDRRFNAASDTVKGDDYQLEQAFLNLFLNALEAMGPNGALRVTTDIIPAAEGPAVPAEARGAHQIRVSVQDTGIGITSQNMARLFEPFFTTKQNGTGLGLPICQRIVREHHGAVTVQSEPNKGTTISIFLPTSARER